jgi:phospholipid/cholesterol/gamma-HCH transport system ATP-binding protein
MLYQGLVRLLGDRDGFRSSADAIVQQFITGSAEGPIE